MTGFAVTTGARPRPRPALPVFLGDDGPYYFTPRKMVRVAFDIRGLAVMLLEGMPDIRPEVVARQDRWLARGFGPEQWAVITARRADPRDSLAQEHIDQLYETLVNQGVQMLKVTT